LNNHHRNSSEECAVLVAAMIHAVEGKILSKNAISNLTD
jgi:hypothetical protein